MFHNKLTSLSGKIKNNKVLVILIAAAFFGGVLGSTFIRPASSQANILGDIYNAFVNGFSQKGTSTTLFAPPAASPTVTSDYEQAIVNAVQKASPSVVSIVISKNVPVVEQCPYNPFSDVPPEFQQFFNFGNGTQFTQPCNTGKTQLQDVGGGSGFIISADGLIITNKHVVSDTGAEYTVFTNDGNKYKATVLARHPTLDIAIVKINKTGLTPLALGDSSDIKLGQTAIAIGNALGEFRNTISLGIVSGLSRTLTASENNGSNAETLDNVIQTSAAINPGNSGGPLLNLSGQVIGINTAMVSGAQNIGFAIPINIARKSIEQVNATGQISVAYLGVRYIMLNPDVAKTYKVTQTTGVLVKGDSNNVSVEKGSPAETGGIKDGDVITKIDGVAVNDSNTLSSVISQKNPGDKISVTLIRNGKEMTVSITLTARK